VKTSEEKLIEQYFDAFNRHDIDAVMACFHDDAVVGGVESGRAEGIEAVRLRYEGEFAAVPDGRCDLQTAVAHDGCGVAESVFHGTTKDGRPIKAVGAEIIVFAGGKIKEIRDYHKQIEGTEKT
jgi:taurine dehydrogenase small subunit